MIDRGDIRQAIDRTAISGLHCRALVMVSSKHKTHGSPDYKIQRSGRNGQRLMYEQSHRLSPLWLSASSSACHGLLVIIDNAIAYKAQRDKNARELKLANAAITDMRMRQHDVLTLDAKYTKNCFGTKLKMMLCVMMLPLVVVDFAHQSSLSVST